MQGISRTKSILLISFLVLVWGVTWPVSKLALAYSPPLLLSGIRTLLGGILLLLVALPRYKEIRFRQNGWKYLVSSLFNIILFYGLQMIGLKYLPSGLFSVIVYFQPVLLGIFARIWLGETLSGFKVLGLILGFLGVATVSLGGLSGQVSTTGILLALGTAVSWAFGTVFVKKAGDTIDSIWLVTVQCIFGGVILTGVGSFREHWTSIVWNMPFVSALLFLSIFSISAAWLIFFLLVRSGEASVVGSYTFFVPLIALTIGTIFMNEPFSINLLIGLVLILTSILFVNKKAKALPPEKTLHPASSNAKL